MLLLLQTYCESLSLSLPSTPCCRSEIYDPATNIWSQVGMAGLDLADTNTYGGSREIGAGILRPDGTMVYFSGNSLGLNAIYDAVAGTWSAPPNLGNFPPATAGLNGSRRYGFLNTL